jgi:hypothetical protein
MTRDPLEVLSALMDGEAVEADVLAAALLAPGAREALVDFARLRAAVAGDASRPSAAFYEAARREVAPRRAPGRVTTRVLKPLAATVVLALAGFGAFRLPTLIHDRGDEPPRATRVLQFTPGVDWIEGDRR